MAPRERASKGRKAWVTPYVPPQGFLNHCPPDAAIGPRHQNCSVLGFHTSLLIFVYLSWCRSTPSAGRLVFKRADHLLPALGRGLRRQSMSRLEVVRELSVRKGLRQASTAYPHPLVARPRSDRDGEPMTS